ncbi:hypothetical protein CTI12_AA608860 [Artemisia annua]|uniref:Uncharacterized protein n=1 Tax=Artemisia annua TaxID=35608 RepID=A0A2U1KFE8_ARTAN|nr:hypothetical protein CTI12_AA608860 [Artemisia annua]
MVIALGPGKFYGSSLPRPRIYTDIKYNTYRVDPPVSVLDPFMSWAEEAHWSMGGLSFNRHRLQGRIEGDIDKIRNHIETNIKKREDPGVPPAPIANKRKRRFVGLVDEEDDDVADDVSGGRKWPVRKLSDEFDRVATKKGEIEGEGVSARTRGRKVAVSETVKSGSKGRKRLRKVGELGVSV